MYDIRTKKAETPQQIRFGDDDSAIMGSILTNQTSEGSYVTIQSEDGDESVDIPHGDLNNLIEALIVARDEFEWWEGNV